jgi:hypothetical protein
MLHPTDGIFNSNTDFRMSTVFHRCSRFSSINFRGIGNSFLKTAKTSLTS